MSEAKKKIAVKKDGHMPAPPKDGTVTPQGDGHMPNPPKDGISVQHDGHMPAPPAEDA
ncbi:hypothetical protein [Streptomyces sp. KL118A]|uniref:hypothetical protein n=1 Tax=Streptomyces sp. KL118A TaxID=3045153 RepID=UPI00278C40AB|nr:hypothetical protein [Streptomyces sp. KL118A]